MNKKLMKNEKGFTLVEILVVIAIIAILFVTLLPQIDNAVNRSRETGIKTDFHTMQIAMETYMRETAGKDLKIESLNKFLDAGMEIVPNGNSSKTTVADGADSTEIDVWGQPYDVYVIAEQGVIIFKSFGPDEVKSTDDYTLATYYHNGQVFSCSSGFDTNNVENKFVTSENCGVLLPDSGTVDTTKALTL